MSMYRSPEKIADYLENWIRERFKEAKAERAVLGISGGIDSALLAALLAKALGPENVTGVIMPCHSMPIDEEYAALLADAIKIKRWQRVDLSAVYDAEVAALEAGGAKPDGLAAANIKPRLRMITLYSIAQQQGALVCGGGNKDEITMGYFTKYGGLRRGPSAACGPAQGRGLGRRGISRRAARDNRPSADCGSLGRADRRGRDGAHLQRARHIYRDRRGVGGGEGKIERANKTFGA